jgi:hypothetical protein
MCVRTHDVEVHARTGHKCQKRPRIRPICAKKETYYDVETHTKHRTHSDAYIPANIRRTRMHVLGVCFNVLLSRSLLRINRSFLGPF